MATMLEISTQGITSTTAERSLRSAGSMPSRSGHRADTLASRCRAVERAIVAMYERIGEPFTLQAMAGVAVFSRFHFDRVFHDVTGIPPYRFLAALRIDAAKALLLTTDLSVTDVCMEVGYHSLGSFTREFTQHVGLPPNALRRLARSSVVPKGLRMVAGHANGNSREASAISGRIQGPVAWNGLIFVGLFPDPIPRGRPVACTVLTGPGPYHISSAPDGCYYLLAVALPWSANQLANLLHDRDSIRVASSVGPVPIRDGRVERPVDLELRAMRITDPPILVALPFLLDGHTPSAGAAIA